MLNKIKNNEIYFIAEIGFNAGKNLELAKKMVKSAKESGADAVKFQTIDTDELLSEEVDYKKIIKDMAPEWSDFLELKKYSDELEIDFFSTPFDLKAVDFLETLKVPYYKIASCDINNFPLIKKIAAQNKPIILSTGASDIKEIEETVKYIKQLNYKSDLVLLHCVSNYPMQFENSNLLSIKYMSDYFKIPIGFSDHSLGIDITKYAISLGAKVIEKHFTIDRNLPGGDNIISILPEELKKLVAESKKILKILGKYEKKVLESEKEMVNIIRRSLFARKDILKDKILDESDISIKRPGKYLEPKNYFNLIGKKTNKYIKKDEPILLKYIY